MNDDELIMVLREQRGKVAMTTPVERIISRGRAVRARRRIPRVAGAAGVAALSAVAVGVALPGSHQAAGHSLTSHPGVHHPTSGPSVRLAAWTVTRKPRGTIQVTFRQATDPAGLQRTLRADGVPASVTFTGEQNPACQGYPGSGVPRPSQLGWWYLGHRHAHPPLYNVVGPPFRNLRLAYNHPQDALIINPAALPSGVGIQIWTSGTPGAADNFQLHVSLVKASQQCPGS